MTHAPLGVVVVGGGPVGAVAAILLARRGYDVRVYERRGDPRRRARHTKRSSLNLALGERGLAPLADAGLDTLVRRVSVPMYGRSIHLDDRSTFQPYGNRDEALHCATRHDVHCALLDAAEREPRVELRFGHRCVAVDLEGPAVAVADPTGGMRVDRAAHVVGADGLHSVVRAAFARHSWFTCRQQLLPLGYREVVVASREPWTRDRNVLHVWPSGRSFLLAFPNRDGSFTLSLHGPTQGDESADALPDGGGVLAKRPNEILTLECHPWVYRDRAVLLGDAAHAVAPYLGQGLSASIEDCFELDRLLGLHDENWTEALRELGALREREVTVFAHLSREHFAELAAGVADPRTRLRRRVEQALNAESPDEFATLHYLVCFTRTPYSQIAEASREQTRLVDEIAADLDPAADDDAVRTAAAEAVRRALAAV